MWERFINRFSLYDLVIIALLAALGIASKPIIVPLSHIITGPLFIPGGVAAGGFYMMWLILGMGITGKRGTATLIGLVQSMVVLGSGVFGYHGALSIISYTIPGIAIDLGLLLIRHRVCCLFCAFIAGILANVSGSFLVNLIYFRLPLVPLLLSLSVAALSGGLGGLLAYQILRKIRPFIQNKGGLARDVKEE